MNLYCLPAFSQVSDNSRHIYSFIYVDSIPRFIGGRDRLILFMKKNLKWPDNTEDVQGTVLMSFVVLSNGKVVDIKIEKSLFPAFDAEARRLIESMPKWVPGKIGSKPVDVKMYFPIDFYIVNK